MIYQITKTNPMKISNQISKNISNFDYNIKFVYIILFFFFFSALFDAVITLIFPSFLALEANPLVIFLNIPAKYIILFIKLGISFAVFSSFKWHKRINQTDMSRFFWIFIIISLTFIQFFAGISNIYSIQRATDVINIQHNTTYTASQVPLEKVQAIAPGPKQAVTAYLGIISLLMYMPLALAMLSFWLWLKIWCK
jgi:hypothetical protein